MYNVENHIEPKTVSLVHEILELIWCPVATGSSKEAGHMIPKTAVVSMFHDCHQFNAVVAKVFDSREQVIGKVGVVSLEREDIPTSLLSIRKIFGFLGRWYRHL